MEQKQNRSLKKSLFINFLLVSLIMTLLFGSLMAVILYYHGINSAYAVIRNKNQAATNYIQGYFTPLRSTIQYLARQPEVINARKDPGKYTQKALSLFAVHHGSLANINYVYSGYEDATLLINDYTPPDNFNPKQRPWYKAALKASPSVSGGIPYKEAKSGKWLVSLSKVLTDDENNLQGVVAIDASMDAVTKNLFERDPAYSSSYSYVVDRQGRVIIHHRSDLLGKKFKDSVVTKDDLANISGSISYSFENQSKIAYYTNLKSLGWTVITVVNKQEIIHTLLNRILVSMLVIIAVSLLIGQIISRTLGNRIIAPLRTLQDHVKAIVSGQDGADNSDKSSSISNYQEIDSIANGIEELTHRSLYQKNRELERQKELLKELSQTDYLTGLLNRRKFNEQLQKEYTRAKRYNSTFSVILLDIDWFKSVNDTHGHDAGDRVLKEISSMLGSMLRDSDSLARWGGEEFLILCPGTDLEGAAATAQKIQIAVAQYDFSVPQSVTISAGACQYSEQMSMDDLINEADHKLYEAKEQGRNRVVF